MSLARGTAQSTSNTNRREISYLEKTPTKPTLFYEIRTGYLKHIKKYTDPVQKAAAMKIGAKGADGVDMTGRVVCVSGANSGIGKELCIYCAAKGAKVYMLCRSKDRAEKAKNEIVEVTSNDQVDILLVSRKISPQLDLSRPSVCSQFLCGNEG